MTYALEKRGYVKAGPWTPECNVEHPDGGQFFLNLRTSTASTARSVRGLALTISARPPANLGLLDSSQILQR